VGIGRRVVLIAWKYLSGAVSGILGGSGSPGSDPAGPEQVPADYYYPGVYGPLAIPGYGGDPFYSSPMGGGRGQGWGGSWPGGPRPRPLGN
jgi:hypothetical protein